MRRKVKNRNIVQPDFMYNSEKLEKFINYIMWSGKKETARKVMYAAFDVIKENRRRKLSGTKRSPPRAKASSCDAKYSRCSSRRKGKTNAPKAR